MEITSNNYKLHSRVTMIFLIIAIVSTITYVSIIFIVLEKQEEAMVATMVGHELDELIGDLSNDPDTKLPKTASVNAFLLSRNDIKPVPEYLRALEPNLYSSIHIGDMIYHAAIMDYESDRLYVQFDVTGASKYQSILFMLLIGGGLFSAVVLIISGFWLSRKFLLPVSQLAEEVSGFSPDDLSLRIEKKYHDFEVGLIAQSFDQFLERISDYVEREQSFAASVSHELRTPVAVIGTSIDLLELKGINENQKAAFGRIKDSTDYMAKVIESLLFFARGTHDAVEKTMPEVKLDEVFQRVVDQYQQQANEKGLELSLIIESRSAVRMSESHIEIILGNLIRNAITNTQQGSVSVVLHEDSFLVADTGQGIKPEELDSIVKRNYHSADSMGCGLGLYLVKNICNIYGLKLNIESTVGIGSKFSIYFDDTILTSKREYLVDEID